MKVLFPFVHFYSNKVVILLDFDCVQVNCVSTNSRRRRRLSSETKESFSCAINRPSIIFIHFTKKLHTYTVYVVGRVYRRVYSIGIFYYFWSIFTIYTLIERVTCLRLYWFVSHEIVSAVHAEHTVINFSLFPNLLLLLLSSWIGFIFGFN